MGRREGVFCDLKGYSDCLNLAIDTCVLCERDICLYHLMGDNKSTPPGATSVRSFRVLFQRLDYSAGSPQPGVSKEAALNIAVCTDCRNTATEALSALASDTQDVIIKHLRAILSARSLQASGPPK